MLPIRSTKEQRQAGQKCDCQDGTGVRAARYDPEAGGSNCNSGKQGNEIECYRFNDRDRQCVMKAKHQQ